MVSFSLMVMVSMSASALTMVKASSAQRDALLSESISKMPPDCDIILFNIKSFDDFEILSANYDMRAKLVLTQNVEQKNEETKCNIMIMDAQNDTLGAMASADEYYFSTRMSLKLVMLTNDIKVESRPRSTYDYDIISDQSVQNYIANDDDRWNELRTAYTVITPFLSKLPGGKWGGLDWSLWDIICRTLGLRLNMAEEHFLYTSAYESLANKSVDLTFPQNPFSFPLRKVSEQTTFVYYETYSFYNVIPGPVTNILTLFYPFNGVVWAWSVAAFLFAFVAIYLINLKTRVSLFNSVQLLLSPLLNDSAARNWGSLNTSWYGYSVLLMWLCSAMLLSFAYTSNLLANLTVVERQEADNTFEDLLKNKRTLAVPEGTFLEDWMKESSRDIIRQVEKECAQERGGYYNVYEFRGVPPTVKEKLETGEASSLVLVSMFSNLVHKYRLGTDILGDTFSTYFLQLRHPKRPLIDNLIGKMTDTGISLKFRESTIWVHARPARDFERHHGSDEAENKELSIKHMYPLWIVLGFGVVVSSLVFIFEKGKNMKKRPINKDKGLLG